VGIRIAVDVGRGGGVKVGYGVHVGVGVPARSTWGGGPINAPKIMMLRTTTRVIKSHCFDVKCSTLH
jgi:hypothetical protein